MSRSGKTAHMRFREHEEIDIFKIISWHDKYVLFDYVRWETEDGE